jgi:hypothetical protein
MIFVLLSLRKRSPEKGYEPAVLVVVDLMLMYFSRVYNLLLCLVSTNAITCPCLIVPDIRPVEPDWPRILYHDLLL